jgi:hypothetical protein
MPWISELPVEHQCDKPAPSDIGNHVCGSVWECDDCHRQYRYGGQTMNGRGVVACRWTEVPSGASDPAAMWSGLLVNLDADKP